MFPASAITAVLLLTTAPAGAQPARGSLPVADRMCRGTAGDRACGPRFEPRFAAYTGTRLGDEIRTNYRIGFGGGVTHSIGRRGALGASLWLMAHDGTSASALLQYRHWMPGGFVADAEVGTYLGAVLDGTIGNYPLGFPSPVVDVGVSFRDWFGLRGRFEWLTFEDTELIDPADPDAGVTVVHRRRQAALIGAQVGRGLGWLGWAAAGVGIAVIGATCCN